jgi:hypothetical protein
VRRSLTSFAYRNLKKTDTVNFTELLRSAEIPVNPPSTADAYAERLELDVLGVIDSLAPLKRKTKREAVKPTALWITDEVKDSKRVRRRLERHPVVSVILK